jgi:Kef-type K+ transport system membrane component KefB
MRRRMLALAIVLLLAWLIGDGRIGATGLRSTAFALGMTLVAAALAGEALEWVRLPRITGYLLFGILCGPYLGNIITRPMAREIQVVNTLAIALIAFIAGLELKLPRPGPELVRLLRFAGAAFGVMYGGLLVLFWLAWPLLPIAPAAAPLPRLVMALLLATIVVSFSPAVTIAVISDSRARGPVSDMTLTLVILGELMLILAFTLVMAATRAVLGNGGGEEVALLARLSWEVLGSVAFGALLGAVFVFFLRHVGKEVTVALLALCTAIGYLAGAIEMESLLAALAAGFVVENVAPPQGEALKRAVERGVPPVLVLFFAAAGASIQLDAVATIGALAVVLAVVRMVFIRLGTGVGLRASPVDASSGRLIWMGLVSQAGVVLGLAVIVANEFPDWGPRLQTLVISLVALNQLAGPAVFRLALANAGEVGRMDLGEPVESESGEAVPPGSFAVPARSAFD